MRHVDDEAAVGSPTKYFDPPIPTELIAALAAHPAPDRVFAEVEHKKLETMWTEARKVTQSGRSFPCFRCIEERGCRSVDGLPGYMDHAQLWLQNGRGVILTAQPYVISRKALTHLLEVCRARGFEMQVDPGGSWWFPGRTMLVEVWNPTLYNPITKAAPTLDDTVRWLESGG